MMRQLFNRRSLLTGRGADNSLAGGRCRLFCRAGGLARQAIDGAGPGVDGGA